MTGRLDPRLHPYRADLAAARLHGTVDAQRFVDPSAMQVSDRTAGVYSAPRPDAEMISEALHGEMVDVYEDTEGWVWGQLCNDGYVGYLPARSLTGDVAEPTHKVSVPRTFVYPVPDIKSVPVASLTLNAGLKIDAEEGAFLRTAKGQFVFTAHTATPDDYAGDYVAVAESLLGAPYLWGGKSIGGLDCSGLVQLACEVAGIPALRDSDMQRDTLGRPLDHTDLSALKRGDILFWHRHVGIMAGHDTLLHATAHTMLTITEPVQQAVRRIADGGADILRITRF